MESAKIYELVKKEIIFPYEGKLPIFDDTVFFASGSKIIGDVEFGSFCSVWYNTVIRGDVHYIKIGEMTNVQDNSMLHVTNGLYPLNIGKMVTIGHNVTLHGCTVKDLVLVGMGAIVLDGAVINEKSMIAAGAVVRPGFIVPSGVLAAGVPAKIVRELTQAEIDELTVSANRYKKYMEITKRSIEEFNQRGIEP